MSERDKPSVWLCCGEVYINPAWYDCSKSNQFFREHLTNDVYMGLTREPPDAPGDASYPYTPVAPKHLFIQDDRIGFGVGRTPDVNFHWDPERKENMSINHTVSHHWWARVSRTEIVF